MIRISTLTTTGIHLCTPMQVATWTILMSWKEHLIEYAYTAVPMHWAYLHLYLMSAFHRCDLPGSPKPLVVLMMRTCGTVTQLKLEGHLVPRVKAVANQGKANRTESPWFQWPPIGPHGSKKPEWSAAKLLPSICSDGMHGPSGNC